MQEFRIEEISGGWMVGGFVLWNMRACRISLGFGRTKCRSMGGEGWQVGDIFQVEFVLRV